MGKFNKIVIALDSFKGSLSSLEAGQAFAQGVIEADSSVEYTVCSVADGGEGTIESLMYSCGGSLITVTVQDPLNNYIQSAYALLDNGTAVIEMAKSSGLGLVPEPKRNPWLTSSRGVGELIADALSRGVGHIILGIGGSATNDAGVGMMQALGGSFTDDLGVEIGSGGGEVGRIHRIDSSRLFPAFKNCRFDVACDVDNPLCGENGASFVYGPQKGANSTMVRKLDANLKHFSYQVETQLHKDFRNLPGAGAAGGLGYGLMAFSEHVQLKSGIEIVLDQIKMDDILKGASLVVVGEGRLDWQTAMGKAPIGIARRAKKYGIPVIAIGGSLGGDPTNLHNHGIDAYFSISPKPETLKKAMNPKNAKVALRRQGRELLRFSLLME